MKLLARISTKRLAVSAVIVLVLAALGAYATWSMTLWQRLDQNVATMKQTSEKVPSTLRSEAPVVATFATLHDDMQTALRDTSCELPAVVGWQRMVPQLSERIEACRQTRELVVKRDDALQQVHHYASGEAALVQALKTAAEKLAALEPTNYEAMGQAWQQAKADIAAVNEGDTAKVKAALTEKIDAIITALDELNKANAAKDRTAFDAAQEKVKHAYAALATVQETTTPAYGEKVDALLEMY